jgi:hypothetical protein
MPPQLIALSDEQMTTVTDIARLIPVQKRSEFLQEVALRLRGVEVGNGSVRRAAEAAWRAVLARPNRHHDPDCIDGTGA